MLYKRQPERWVSNIFRPLEDYRYQFFKRKMNSFLHNPVTISAIKASTTTAELNELSPIVRKEMLKKSILDYSKSTETGALKELLKQRALDLSTLQQQIVQETGQQEQRV